MEESPGQMREENNFDLSFHEQLPQDSTDRDRAIINSKQEKSLPAEFNNFDKQLEPDAPIFDNFGLSEDFLVLDNEKVEKNAEFAVPARPKPKIISNVTAVTPMRLIKRPEVPVSESDESFLAGVPRDINFEASESFSQEPMRRSRYSNLLNKKKIF